jgi:hypothetical protein
MNKDFVALTSFKNVASSIVNSASHPGSYLHFANPSQLQQQGGNQGFAEMQYMQTGEEVDFLDPNFSSSKI